MQINKIDNTSFGMLKIDKGLKAELSIKPDTFLKTLDNLGEKISDIKLYNIFFDKEKGFDTPIIRDLKTGTADYFAQLRHEESLLGQYYEVPSGMHGDTVSGFYPKEPFAFKKLYGENAAKKYKEFKALDIYNQAAEYSRILEQIELKRLIQEEKNKSEKLFAEQVQKIKQEKHESAVDELLSKYENDIVITENNNTDKKSFADRIKYFFKNLIS